MIDPISKIKAIKLNRGRQRSKILEFEKRSAKLLLLVYFNEL